MKTWSGPITTAGSILGRPLRWLGLEAGRARANARPDVSRLRTERVEQFAYIADKLAAADEPLVLIAPDRCGTGPDDVSIAVLDGDRLVTGHAALDAPLRDSISRATDAAVPGRHARAGR
jgi:hypothetical protein